MKTTKHYYVGLSFYVQLRVIQIFDTLLAISLIPSSCLLQHNANIGKDKVKNVIAAPNYLFHILLKLLCLWCATTLYKQQVLT